jgi:restriction system protein
MDKATRFTDFRTTVQQLQKEGKELFNSLVDPNPGQPPEPLPSGRGVRTPEEAFVLPILQSLVELGGSSRVTTILDRVELKMKTALTDFDRWPLHPGTKEIRWRNTAMWCRNRMVKITGFLKSDSRHGIWEISEKGRLALKNNSV